MFDYFGNYSSNAHQLCGEDSPTKGLYDHYNPMTLTFIQGHKCVSNVTTFFNLQYLGPYLSYYVTFKLSMTVALCMAYICMLLLVLMTLKLTLTLKQFLRLCPSCCFSVDVMPALPSSV